MKSKITVCVLFLLLTIFLPACNDEKDNPLTPAQKITGVYSTDKQVKVNIKTDFCSFILEDVAYEFWNLRLEIKETLDKDIVDITMTYIRSGYTVTNAECEGRTGYLPEPSPMFAKGYMEGNVLTVKYAGEEIMVFDISNLDLISGGLKYSYCLVYCQELYTDQVQFELTKEK